MKKIKLSELREGMILGEPLEDAMGRVLLGAGEKLCRQHLGKLERFGITEVMIKETVPTSGPGAAPEPVAPGSAPSNIPALDNFLQKKFARWEGDEAMDTIKKVARNFLVKGGLTKSW